MRKQIFKAIAQTYRRAVPDVKFIRPLERAHRRGLHLSAVGLCPPSSLSSRQLRGSPAQQLAEGCRHSRAPPCRHALAGLHHWRGRQAHRHSPPVFRPYRPRERRHAGTERRRLRLLHAHRQRDKPQPRRAHGKHREVTGPRRGCHRKATMQSRAAHRHGHYRPRLMKTKKGCTISMQP